MEKRTELEKMIVELKLAKRELVLLGKSTNVSWIVKIKLDGH